MIRRLATLVVILLTSAITIAGQSKIAATTDDGTPYLLNGDQQQQRGTHITCITPSFLSRGVTGINLLVSPHNRRSSIQGPGRGGYFTGVHAQPAESPIGYPLKLFGQSLLNPPRGTSYCSGASYTGFIETLNLLFPNASWQLSAERLEAMRMQEPDGSRRNDWVKFWGYCGTLMAPAASTQFALIQYSGMGMELSPRHARPGDFVNINWTNGLGHSVIFLGWSADSDGHKSIRFWSSQTGTHGLGDQTSAVVKKFSP